MRNTFSRKSRLHGHLSPGTISLMNMYLYIKLPHTKSVSSLCEKTFWYKTKTSSKKSTNRFAVIQKRHGLFISFITIYKMFSFDFCFPATSILPPLLWPMWMFHLYLYIFVTLWWWSDNGFSCLFTCTSYWFTGTEERKSLTTIGYIVIIFIISYLYLGNWCVMSVSACDVWRTHSSSMEKPQYSIVFSLW